jgi:hypothetical protein
MMARQDFPAPAPADNPLPTRLRNYYIWKFNKRDETKKSITA